MSDSDSDKNNSEPTGWISLALQGSAGLSVLSLEHGNAQRKRELAQRVARLLSGHSKK